MLKLSLLINGFVDHEALEVTTFQSCFKNEKLPKCIEDPLQETFDKEAYSFFRRLRFQLENQALALKRITAETNRLKLKLKDVSYQLESTNKDNARFKKLILALRQQIEENTALAIHDATCESRNETGATAASPPCETGHWNVAAPQVGYKEEEWLCTQGAQPRLKEEQREEEEQDDDDDDDQDKKVEAKPVNLREQRRLRRVPAFKRPSPRLYHSMNCSHSDDNSSLSNKDDDCNTKPACKDTTCTHTLRGSRVSNKTGSKVLHPEDTIELPPSCKDPSSADFDPTTYKSWMKLKFFVKELRQDSTKLQESLHRRSEENESLKAQVEAKELELEALKSRRKVQTIPRHAASKASDEVRVLKAEHKLLQKKFNIVSNELKHVRQSLNTLLQSEDVSDLHHRIKEVEEQLNITGEGFFF